MSPEKRQKFVYHLRIIMEYKKITNLLDNTPNQQTKLSTKKWVEINDDPRRKHNTNNQIQFKTSMLKSSLFVILLMNIYLLKELHEL